jgi:hypothetical protein
VDWGSRTSTPGASLSFQEISRSGRKRVYHILVQGLPLEGNYALVQWPITLATPSASARRAFIDPTGVLLCKKNGDVNSSDDTWNLTIDNVLGEPARIGVINIEDKSIRALGKITPRPIESVDKNCHLSVTYLTPHGELVFVEATGLAPGEPFSMALHSGSKEVKQGGKASESGDYRITFLPFDPKSSSGKGRAQLKLRADSCSPSADFAWGDLLNE